MARTLTSAQKRKIDEAVERCRENARKAAGIEPRPDRPERHDPED